MTSLLLQTKFFKPVPRPALITRQYLIERLNEGLGHGAGGFAARLTLVSAPAGFGKTTLVSAWLAQLAFLHPDFSAENCAWLSLDENDNDAVRFLMYLAVALQTITPHIGHTAVRALKSPEPPAAEAVLTQLINDVSQNGLPIILVLDDYHVIRAPSVHQALTYLLEHLSPLLHLMIITRSDPPLPLSRWRARSHLVELRTDELRFSIDEVRQFFNKVWNLAISNEEIAALERRTEGWVTGLQLAALSLQGRDDQAELIAAFAGSHHFVIDYLTEEVLSRQPDSVREFLLATSILERVCGSLADALVEAKTGQETLEYLEHSNLFLTPLDEERHWYRYHQLFAEVLQARLLQTYSDRLRELHRRAGVWHARQGMVDEAVRHALAGDDPETAATLIEGVAGNMLRQGASASLIRWLDALPVETIRARPRLCLARGWTFVWGAVLDRASAEEWVQHALEAPFAGKSSESGLKGEVAALQAMIAATWKDGTHAIELAGQALVYLPADSPWRGVMNFCLGSTYYDGGDPAAASEVLEEALALSEADGVHYIQLIVASFLADITAFQGHLGRAGELYRQVLARADEGLPQKGTVMAHGGLANILFERNELNAALVHLREGTAQLPQVGGTWPSLAIYRTLARVRQAEGKRADAMAALGHASEVVGGARQMVAAMEIAAMRARLHLAGGDLAAAEAWAGNCGLSIEDPDTGHGGLQEVAYLSLARVASAQGRHAEALVLLDRLMQPAQEEARQGSMIAIHIVQALINQAQGHRRCALESLERALVLAEPEGYCRVFVDEGQPMADLLRWAWEQGICADYVDRLLRAFGPKASTLTSQDLLPEPLSERELEVLRLAAAGATNKQIAGEVFIALPTVKKHMGHILVKLDTHNRVQAEARARELGLLS